MILYSSTEGATAPDDGSAVLAVRDMILERVGETGLANDTEIRRWVRRANRKVWTKAIERNPTPWKVRTPTVTFPAAAGKLSMDVLGGFDPDDSGDLAMTFGAAQIAKVLYVEANYLGGWFPIFDREGDDRWLTEPGIPLSPSSGRLPSFFYIEGNDLYFSRPPATDLDIRATVVPVIPDPADGEHMLQGRFPAHHDLVATEAARLLFSKDERQTTPWDAERTELMQDFLTALSNGQGKRVRRITATGPYSP